MCRSIQTSLATFAVSVGCMIAAVAARPTREIKYIAAFVITFTMMQLADALIWYGIHNKREDLNVLGSTYMVPVVLSAELIVAYYAAGYFLGWRNRTYEICMWIVVIIMYGTWIRDCLKDPVTKTDETGYLVWCNVGYNDYSLLLFLSFLLLPMAIAYPNGWIKATVITIAIVTWLMYLKNAAFGSRWCWISNIVSVVVLALVLLGYK